MASSSHPLSIFREYILQLTKFPDIINPKTQNFDFILGFASETNGKGQFEPKWIAGLSPQRVGELKGKYPDKARVVISIGGSVGSESEFNPTVPRDKWIANAVSSIKRIITQQYDNQIDGIDIHYDVIKSSGADFASYIGQVIRQLKNDPELSNMVVSIAPTKNVQDHYLALYLNNRDNIDWIDYRFYNQEFSTVREFTNSYNAVVVAYDAAGKVLAGISMPPDPIIFDGIKSLIENNSTPGAFVWNADKSAVSSPPFIVEGELQNL